MGRLLNAKELAMELQVHAVTISNWLKAGKIKPERATRGKRKLFDLDKVAQDIGRTSKEKHALIYINKIMLKSEEQCESELLIAKQYCASKGLEFEVFIDDAFSTPSKDAMDTLINAILDDNAACVVINKESSFGFNGNRIIQTLCKVRNIPLVAIEKQREKYKDFILSNIATAQKLCEMSCGEQKSQFARINGYLNGALNELC